MVYLQLGKGTKGEKDHLFGIVTLYGRTGRGRVRVRFRGNILLKNQGAGFPLLLIGAAVVVSPGIVWLQYPGVVIADLSAMAAGQALALVGMAYAAYAFSRRTNNKALEIERTDKARRVAWITLVVVSVVLSAPYFLR